MRTVNWVGCILAAGLAGCSLYPIPDDVSPFSTEEIIRYGRCEVRDAILAHMIDRGIITPQYTAKMIRDRIEAVKAKKNLTDEKEIKLLRLTKVAVVYSFDFNITEHNRTAAGAGFRLPWLTNMLDVGATAALDLTRQGSRVFGTEDSWDDLITNSSLCEVPWQRPGNIVYPLTGSIGVGRVVETFIDIDQQGEVKDNFVDTLTFTTAASGGADATLKLEPVPNQFRPVSATAAVSASRLDIHKLTISLAVPPPAPIPGITGVVRAPGDLNAPFERPPAWQARYNLCVQDARTRESSFKQLRLTDPVVYCIAYADEFAPQYANRKVAVTVPRRVLVEPGAAGGSGAAGTRTAPRTMVVPETIERSVRPNLRPLFLQ